MSAAGPAQGPAQAAERRNDGSDSDTDSSSDGPPPLTLLRIYRDVVAGIGALTRDEADTRRDILIAFELGRPTEGSSGGTGSPYRMDPDRAARRALEDREFDARGEIIHEEFGAHVALLQQEPVAAADARYRSEAALRRRCDLLDRAATLGVLQLLAEAYVAGERLAAVADRERRYWQGISDARRAVEHLEADGRESISNYAATGLRAILRDGHAERRPLMPLQAAYAERVEREREERVRAALEEQRLARVREDKAAVEAQEAKARRTLRQQEASEYGDMQRSETTAVLHFARSRAKVTRASIASFGGSVRGNASFAASLHGSFTAADDS